MRVPKTVLPRPVSRRVWIIGLVSTLVMVAVPVGAVHDQTAETLVIPWQHNGETFTAEVGQPFEVGARWGACTADLADDFPVWPDLTGPTLEVSGPAASWPEVEWSDPINPPDLVTIGEITLCAGTQTGFTGWWVYWRTPITFNATGTYQVTLSMSTATPIYDGVSSPIVDVAGTITVEVGRFADTHRHPFESDIEWLVEQEVTKGCNAEGTLFCPDDLVTRGQMAAFLSRAMNLPDGALNTFTDDNGSIFEADIAKIAEAGITKGCNAEGTLFCPNDFVTRGQMAAFLVRALGFTDNGGGNLFTDDNGSIFEDDIDKLATAGVTKGCNAEGTLFCPNDFVTRGQMAAFLHRALGA